MQQPRSKTYQEMVADLLEMEQKSQDPNSTPERRKAFSDAADTIRRKLASTVGTPISAPPRHRPAPAQSSIPRSRSTATKITLNTAPQPPLKIATAAPHRYQASHTSVTIHWPSGEQTYRYYQVRSRLYVSLKNLVHSTANNQVTYKEIQHYAAWSNAQTYYAALTAIWGHPPTFEQLDFSPSTLDLQALEEMFHQVVKDIAP